MPRRFASIALVVLGALLAGCSGSGNGKAPASNTVKAAAASPTPSPTPPPSYQIAALLTATKCGGGFNVTNASVVVRDEHDTVIGAATTGENVAPRPTPPPGALLLYEVNGDPLTRFRTDDDRAQVVRLTSQDYAAIAVWVAAVQLCQVKFFVNVPKAAFYQMTIGTHKSPTYSFDEMLAQGFRQELTLK